MHSLTSTDTGQKYEATEGDSKGTANNQFDPTLDTDLINLESRQINLVFYIDHNSPQLRSTQAHNNCSYQDCNLLVLDTQFAS